MYGGNAYGSVPYAGGSGAAEVVVVIPVHDPTLGIMLAAGALLSVEVPVVAVPAHLVRTVRVEKAMAYPTPTVVNGRPT